VLELADLPEPEVSEDHDVRVQVKAAGINPVDYKLRSGGTIGGSLPAVLGWDGAGIVESIGPEVTRMRPNDESTSATAAPRPALTRSSRSSTSAS
jgi:NADPH2:quinone reductase